MSLSSYGLFTVLDELLDRAVSSCAFRSGVYLEEAVASIVSKYSASRSTYVRNERSGRACLFVFLAACSPLEERLKYLSKAALNRAYLDEILSGYVSYAEGFNLAYTSRDLPALLEYEYLFKMGYEDLYLSFRDTEFWLDKYHKLRELILQKYHRLLVQLCANRYRVTPEYTSMEALLTKALEAAYSSLDRFSIKRGVFTPYLKAWVSSSIKFMPPEMLSYSGEIEDLEDEEDSMEALGDMLASSQMRWYLRYIDPSGVGRQVLHLDEVLSSKEVQALKGFQ